MMQQVHSVLVILVVCLWAFHSHWISTFPVFPVEVCPDNATEVEKVSEKLNCTFGFNENRNEYHCVPLVDFTQLVEFCYPKISGLIENGLCMVLYEDTLDARKCHQFQDGCPDKHYTSETMYQFPACSKINKESKCYLADPSCPPLWQLSSTTSPNTTAKNINSFNTTTNRNTTTNTATTTHIIIGIFIPLSLLVLLVLVYFIFKRKRGQRRDDKNKSGDEENMQLLEEKEGSGRVEDYTKDEEFQKRFQQYLEEGSVDVCPISQIIILGENGVGKTTLLYRLQGRSQEEIDRIKSTRGIDYHTEKSGFIVTEGQLKLNEEGKSNLGVSPENVLEGVTRGQLKKEDTKEEYVIAEDKVMTEVKIREEDKRETKKAGDDEDTLLHRLEKNTEEQTLTDERNSSAEEPNALHAKTDGNLKEIHPSASEMNKTADSNDQPKTDENAKMKARAKKTECADVFKDHGKKISAVKRKLAEGQKITMKLRRRNEVILNVLDFAGQGAYYASHQAHMRKGAIYIIVFDASRSLFKRKMPSTSADDKADKDPIASSDDTCLCDRPNTSFSCWSQADYIHYWLDTIQVHGGSCGNIILVGTHKDKVTNWRVFKPEFDKMVNEIAKQLPTKRRDVFLDLSRMNEQDENELGNIKEYICKVVSKSERHPLPAKWIKYEGVFEIIKSEMPVIGIDDLLEIFDQKGNEVWDVEIHDMLRYFHENGSILFFNTDRLREIIIVDIQWFVDCFKHIITDKEHAIDEHGIVDTEVEVEWNIFWRKGLLTLNLYKLLLDAKASNLLPEHRERLGDYQQKLGMMLDIKDFEISVDKKIDGWYVPSVNTETFVPDITKYENAKASSILCFRFRDCLPLDLFGRMVVLSLSSGKWSSARRRLYKDGAHLHYSETGENNDVPLEVYLFTSKDIITVQILNALKPEQQGKGVRTKSGEGVRTEVQNIIQDLLGNFYACSKNCETGFLCSKKEGYKESSVQHFISMDFGKKTCYECGDLARDEMKQASEFWNCSSREDSISSAKERGDKRGERHWIAACCQAYLKVREQILFEKDMDFGTFYISLMTNMDPTATSTEGSHLAKYQMEDLEKLDSFVDIGLRLKHLYKISRTTNGDKSGNIEEIKDIACTLKTILLAFGDKRRHLRRDFFFSWTDIVGDINTIPEISLTVPNLQFGDNVKLRASVDVDVSRFIWLKKNDAKNRYEILQTGKPTFRRMKSDLFQLTKFSEDDEGHYQLIVATKRTVGRKSFQLQV